VVSAVATASCSDDDLSAAPADGGSEASTPQPEAGPGDAGGCAADLDLDGVYKHLECSGLYSSFTAKTVATDVREYKPGVEFWSDGAQKQRWIHLPAGSKIDISDFDEWTFPNGTKVWKEFKVGGKRIETRFYMKKADGTWSHTSYRWNADETDAVRNDAGESIPGLGPNGVPYEVPNTGQCDECHMGRKDQMLGFEAVSLGLATATGLTLEKLASEGWLSKAPPKTQLAFPNGSAPDPSKAPAAVGWVHANCGACHNENENAAATFRAHFRVRATDLAPIDGGTPRKVEDLDVYTQGYCKDAFRNEPDAGPRYKYIRGGSPSRSLMSVLAHGRVKPDQLPSSGVQMPPIVTRAPDEVGVKKLDDWILTLKACSN
jgi:hypothetical protein